MNEAVQLLNEYNTRLASEMEDRKKLATMLRDFHAEQKELLVQAEQRLEVSMVNNNKGMLKYLAVIQYRNLLLIRGYIIFKLIISLTTEESLNNLNHLFLLKLGFVKNVKRKIKTIFPLNFIAFVKQKLKNSNKKHVDFLKF